MKASDIDLMFGILSVIILPLFIISIMKESKKALKELNEKNRNKIY